MYKIFQVGDNPNQEKCSEGSEACPVHGFQGTWNIIETGRSMEGRKEWGFMSLATA